MDYVYEVVFCRETIMICSSRAKAEAAIDMLLKEEYEDFQREAFQIVQCELDRYNLQKV